ncbi:carboxypeptidase-like regulatory domain-containing protein [Planctomicrobium sp. SH664]|uniref:carboxypeptidase-like regulatory domain-containing protein n=1 Tax=Planctomicrobium sp. SH664 TaxID=3448125 RepID=UPI003F5B4C02
MEFRIQSCAAGRQSGPFRRGMACWSIVMLASLYGCGGAAPDRGTVSGTVTLNGTPAPRVTVIFHPENGRPSQGLTDAEGKYTLSYTIYEKGAMIGKHTVSIANASPDDGDTGPASQPAVRIPAKYDQASTLTAEVKAGHNVIDFQLDDKK